MDYRTAVATWAADQASMERYGIVLPQVRAYLPDEFRYNFGLAMDALPTLTTDPNSGVPALLTTLIDPEVFEILFAPNKAVEIFGELRKGDWLMDTAMFPVAEATGEVSSYGDYSENGRAGVNTNWPQRQSYLYQLIKEYGEREMERAGLARINWQGEIDKSAVKSLRKFENFSYFFGIQGLQNYGLLNDPNLSAALTPAVKAAGGTAWISGGVFKATANEVYADIEALYYLMVQQTGGLVDKDTPMVLGLSPASETAMTITNSFNVNVVDLLKKNFPNLKVVTAVQYGPTSTQNQQGTNQLLGAASGLQVVQLIATEVDGQRTGFCAYSEKLRNHPIVRMLSAFKQKATAGTWGTVLRMPVAVAQMAGV